MAELKADFSGYATKNGIKCSDGRTISHGAFKHHDQQEVPLIWRHQHSDMVDVLGHALLEHRDDGVYAYGFFNNTEEGKRAKELVHHGDIKSLSIFANDLVHQGMNVVRGNIREVSLVMAGANPGAFIDQVFLEHSDGTRDVLEDAGIIYMGFELEHTAMNDNEGETVGDQSATATLNHSKGDVASILADFTDEQMGAVTSILGKVLAHEDSSGQESTEDADDDKSVKDIYDAFTDEQKDAVGVIIAQTIEAAKAAEGSANDSSDASDSDAASDSAAHSDTSNTDSLQHTQEGTTTVTTNIFEKQKNEAAGRNSPGALTTTLSHDQMATIDTDARTNNKKLSETFLAHAATYGIENIDLLFPDARTLTSSPDFLSRRMEWVTEVLSNTRHTPFARIKSIVADITAEEARAKGYVKGEYKKEEIIKMLRRVTTPKTVYKKQKLDRDDIIDITEIDVVVWLKAEMRLMLDEEIAAAILVGDGREPDDEDKIDEDSIRPIAYDIEMYNTSVVLPAGEFDPSAFTDLVVESLEEYKGTGTPTLFTTARIYTKLSLQKDTLGRRLYATPDELAAALQVKKIVRVEAMGRTPDVVGIIVNLADYTTGTDRGGEISWFDDFDIDYNQNKYLGETRLSGALTRPKSAITFKTNPGSVITQSTLTAGAPTFVSGTGVATVNTVPGIVFKNKDTGATLTAGAQSPIAQGAELNIVAVTQAGYTFEHGVDADWEFFRPRP